jgi:hypothetical protein
MNSYYQELIKNNKSIIKSRKNKNILDERIKNYLRLIFHLPIMICLFKTNFQHVFLMEVVVRFLQN